MSLLGIVKITQQTIISNPGTYIYPYTVTVTSGNYTKDGIFSIKVVDAATYNGYTKGTFTFVEDYPPPDEVAKQAALWNATIAALKAKNQSVTIYDIVQKKGSVITETISSGPLNTTGLQVTVDGTTYTQSVPCILSFSQIRMSDGTVKRISDIEAGEEVVSALTHKPVKVKAIRRRVVDYKTLNEENHIRVIPKDFLGENSPSKDLYISGLHCVMLKVADTTGLPRNRLSFQSRRLSNTFKLPTPEEIISLTGEDEVVYYHIDLDGLDAVYCEDLPIESYYREN
jgi:hypothetical protein